MLHDHPVAFLNRKDKANFRDVNDCDALACFPNTGGDVFSGIDAFGATLENLFHRWRRHGYGVLGVGVKEKIQQDDEKNEKI